jgi:hypothetical protein
MDLLDQGAHYFGLYGMETSMLLFFKSLPSAYVCPRGATVLHATGRLEEFAGSTAKFQRRLMETAQFVLNVSSPGAFRPKGKGIENAMKVRLMHAAIRYYIRRDGHWDAEALGLPINQEDMAGTMLSFSALTREGIDTMGIPVDPALSKGYFHIWQVTGYLMGLDPRMIPGSEADGHTLGHQILDRNMGSSVQGKELTKALVDFTRDAIPMGLFKHMGEIFIRHYCGDVIADDLGVRRFGWFRRVLVPRLIDLFMRDIAKVENIDGFTSRLSMRLSRHFLQHTIDSYYGYKKVEFEIEPSLRKQWGLQPGKLAATRK